ncbi:MAG: DNA polymerase III subunit psi [Ferrimonas sp.]
MSSLTSRQMAILQQMGVTVYQTPRAPVALCLVGVEDSALSHPLVQDVLRLLAIAPEQCRCSPTVEAVSAQRYWLLKFDMPTLTDKLHTLPLDQLTTPAAKRRLWQRLQSWL